MKDFKAIVSDHLTKQHSEKRYVVVSKDGDVLDTNDGQGFILHAKQNKQKMEHNMKYEHWVVTFGLMKKNLNIT